MKKTDLDFLETNKNLSDKINNLYRLAEFGRLSAGAFHDLMSPLTVVLLNLEKLNKLNNNLDDYPQIKESLTQAILASRKMEDLICCLKRYLNQTNTKSFFFMEQEINSAIKILNYHTVKNNIKIVFHNKLKNKPYFGDPVKFNQIIYNLLSNAVESCMKQKGDQARKIVILLDKRNNKIILKVSDYGPGIKKQLLKKIFLPFFSTKKSCGLGLYITKYLTEKEFLGEIKINSQINKKTAFSIIIPQISKKDARLNKN